ncbi:MAG: hypothetical protein ACODAA_00305 [Gemmatimonadota bacterium]
MRFRKPYLSSCGWAVIAAVMLPSPAAGMQQATDQAAAEPSDTLVARLDVSEAALLDATNSVELIDALREHLVIDLTNPFDETVSVSLKGKVGAGDGSGLPYHFQLRGFRWNGPGSLENFSVAQAIDESHGEGLGGDGWEVYDPEPDRDGSSTWDSLIEALDVGLTQAGEDFWRLDDDPVGLQVTGAHLETYRFDAAGGGDWEEYQQCCEEFDNPILKLTTAVSYSSMLEAAEDGTGPQPYEQNVLVIELVPGDPPAGQATESLADAEALQMSQMIAASSCLGADVGSLTGSESRVLAAGTEMTGQALVERSGDGTHVVLGAVEGETPHCLVLASPVGALGPGRYPVLRISQERLAADPTDEAPFFVAAFNADDATLVTDEGHLDIESVEPRVRASFELTGWVQTADGQRHEEITITGSFTAETPPDQDASP